MNTTTEHNRAVDTVKVQTTGVPSSPTFRQVGAKAWVAKGAKQPMVRIRQGPSPHRAGCGFLSRAAGEYFSA
ncbi:MAG TPA: hypothetical protein VGG44_05435, partial [Tepidisphaeraceae bacterium]